MVSSQAQSDDLTDSFGSTLRLKNSVNQPVPAHHFTDPCFVAGDQDLTFCFLKAVKCG